MHIYTVYIYSSVFYGFGGISKSEKLHFTLQLKQLSPVNLQSHLSQRGERERESETAEKKHVAKRKQDDCFITTRTLPDHIVNAYILR